MKIRNSLLALAAVFAAPTAWAHHSSAMFDFTKKVTIAGTVKEWQFTNPHCWLIVMTTTPEGKQELWSLEGGSPGLTSGLTPSIFKPGQKVTVITNPMRDGRKAGTLNYVKFEDGQVWQQASPYGKQQ